MSPHPAMSRSAMHDSPGSSFEPYTVSFRIAADLESVRVALAPGRPFPVEWDNVTPNRSRTDHRTQDRLAAIRGSVTLSDHPEGGTFVVVSGLVEVKGPPSAAHLKARQVELRVGSWLTQARETAEREAAELTAAPPAEPAVLVRKPAAGARETALH